MDFPTQTSNPGEQDDDPDISNATAGAEQERKARVRFNSRAATSPPTSPKTLSVPSAVVTTEKLKSPARPHSILRGASQERVQQRDAADQAAVDHAALAAQSRGHALADTVLMVPPASSRSSFESLAYTSSGESDDELLLGHARGIALQRLDVPGHLGPRAENPDHDTVNGVSYATDQKAGPLADSTPDGKTKQTDRAELIEIYDGNLDGSYDVPTPETYRGSILSQLLKLRKSSYPEGMRELLPSIPGTSGHSPGGSVSSESPTPGRRKWYDQRNESRATLATLIGASKSLATPANPAGDGRVPRPSKTRVRGIADRLSALFQEEEVQAKIHISGTLSRQAFILKMCKALMLYGAPTHRLEEYLTATARALEIEAQFLYIPGCMIISFDDTTTHTTEVKLVRLAQGIDLGKLKDVHHVYKEVIHDVTSVEDATERLDDIMAKRAKFHPWLRVLIFGLTSVTAAPPFFDGRMIDLPLLFFFGCLVGFLQLIVAPRSPLYSNIFEVSATVLISFLARAFGSIRGGDLFCFSALTQGGIVMLLPGYTFLSSSLEMQARAIVPGSIRIVFGVLYTLLLGFGITIGAALYGLADENAVSDLQCTKPLPGTLGFAFVPPFVLCIVILYQAKWRQMPVMILITFGGYIVNYYSTLRFPSSPPIASALGAFAVGVLANLYSRFRHGVAAAILIPAIFTQVPGGLASTGGLLSGLKVASEINDPTTPANGTVYDKAGSAIYADILAFSFAGSMIQITIGITVGLFLSALLVWPLGKRKSGLFSF